MQRPIYLSVPKNTKEEKTTKEVSTKYQGDKVTNV